MISEISIHSFIYPMIPIWLTFVPRKTIHANHSIIFCRSPLKKNERVKQQKILTTEFFFWLASGIQRTSKTDISSSFHRIITFPVKERAIVSSIFFSSTKLLFTHLLLLHIVRGKTRMRLFMYMGYERVIMNNLVVIPLLFSMPSLRGLPV